MIPVAVEAVNSGSKLEWTISRLFKESFIASQNTTAPHSKMVLQAFACSTSRINYTEGIVPDIVKSLAKKKKKKVNID